MHLKNMILGELKIGEHQAKCRALLPNIVKDQKPHRHIHDDFLLIT